MEPSRQPKFSVSLVTTGWGTALALTHVATDSFSYVCSQNLHLASFPQVPAGHEPHTDDPSRSSRMLQCSHTRLPSLSSITSCPFRPGRESRKQSAFEETQGLRLWGVGSGFWVWRQVAPAPGNSTHRDHSNLLIPSSNQRDLGGVLGLLQLLCPTGDKAGTS